MICWIRNILSGFENEVRCYWARYLSKCLPLFLAFSEQPSPLMALCLLV
ncbi:hypothetical protein EV06_1522 [Prochlorococcus sp. MIT 0602]|nr:hypothetical protein EV06_1522 [Prochlorococcus sp. MIT 0602]KGG17154.1 hypothetical protein EV07_0588 [Prochlorococcus sp. MIT 0603]